MSNIDNIIMDIKKVQTTYDFWIRDENGNLKDNIICAEIIPILEELRWYEIDISQEEIKKCFQKAYNSNIVESNNSYNWSAPIDHDFNYIIIKNNALLGTILIFSIHRYGDVRCNYTDYAMCHFDDEFAFYGLNSMCQFKQIKGTPLTVNINVFSETYDVYDNEVGVTMCGFYDLEVKDLLISMDKKRKDD